MTFSQQTFYVMLFSFVNLLYGHGKVWKLAFSPQLSAISVLSCFLTQNVLIDRVWCVSELHTHDSIRIFPFLAISHPCNSMVAHDFMSGIISSDTAVAVD
jgi:hypothetical protein